MPLSASSADSPRLQPMWLIFFILSFSFYFEKNKEMTAKQLNLPPVKRKRTNLSCITYFNHC